MKTKVICVKDTRILNPDTIAILCYLHKHEKTVKQIVENLHISTTSAYRHIHILKENNLLSISNKKEKNQDAALYKSDIQSVWIHLDKNNLLVTDSVMS